MALEEKDLIAFSKLVDEKMSSMQKGMNSAFRTVNLKLDNQKKDLKRIEDQTTKTNGRVNELENNVNNIRLDEVKHIISCPQIAEIEELRKDLISKKADTNKQLDEVRKNLLEYDMLKKYPKIGLGIVAVSCVALVFATWSVLSNFMDDLRTELRTELKTEIRKEISDSINR